MLITTINNILVQYCFPHFYFQFSLLDLNYRSQNKCYNVYNVYNVTINITINVNTRIERFTVYNNYLYELRRPIRKQRNHQTKFRIFVKAFSYANIESILNCIQKFLHQRLFVVYKPLVFVHFRSFSIEFSYANIIKFYIETLSAHMYVYVL